MKKNPKQIAAIVALAAIAALIICFVISAFNTSADSRNTFFALFFCIIAVPILAWLFLLCYGRFKRKHTMAEFFPESSTDSLKNPNCPSEKKDEEFTEEEVIEAMENSRK